MLPTNNQPELEEDEKKGFSAAKNPCDYDSPCGTGMKRKKEVMKGNKKIRRCHSPKSEIPRSLGMYL